MINVNDIKNGIELTQSATDYLPLPIDKDYAINELVDGYEAEGKHIDRGHRERRRADHSRRPGQFPGRRRGHHHHHPSGL